MSNMLLTKHQPETCGYVCRCGADIHAGSKSTTKQKIKKIARLKEKRSWKSEDWG